MATRFPQFEPYTVDYVKTLFKNKRRTYREEKKKMLYTKSGQGADDVYIGKWKFFKAMMFIDNGAPAESRTYTETYGMATEEEYGQSPENSLVESQDPAVDASVSNTAAAEAPVPQASEAQSAVALANANQAAPKRKRIADHQLALLQQRTDTLSKMAKTLDNSSPDDCSAFASVLAHYLRKLPLAKRAKCQAAVLTLMTTYLEDES
ncbi:uncharacterized protein LOC144133655 [Amblyomma americanum]